MRTTLAILALLFCGCSKQVNTADAIAAFQALKPGYTIDHLALEEREVAVVTFLVTANSQPFRLTYWTDSGEWKAVPR